jgi:hypothetical protein
LRQSLFTKMAIRRLIVHKRLEKVVVGVGENVANDPRPPCMRRPNIKYRVGSEADLFQMTKNSPLVREPLSALLFLLLAHSE